MSTGKDELPVSDPIADAAAQGAGDIASQGTTVSDNGYQNIIKQMLASGGKKLNGIRVKNVNATDKDNYTMISFSLASPIDGYVADPDTGVYTKGKTNTVFTSLYAIAGAMKEDEDLAFAANHVRDNPHVCNMIFNGGTVDIIQTEVPAGTPYYNPFTTQTNAEPLVYDHDIVINNIVRFKLGNKGKQILDRLVDKMLGF